MALLLTLLLAAPAWARESAERARVRQAVETAWRAHAEERTAAGNRRFADDPVTLTPSIARLRIGRQKVSFDGLWTWSPHTVQPGRVRAFVSRADLEAGGELRVQFGGRTLPGILRDLRRRRGSTQPWAATWELKNPAEITTYALGRETIDPLGRWRIAEAVRDWGEAATESSWWLTLRAIDTPPAPWPAPRPAAKLIRDVRRAATREGRGDWTLQAIYTVEHPEEIRAIVDFVAKNGDPNLGGTEVALGNLRFMAKDLVVPLQSKEWLKALDAVAAAPPPPLPRAEQKPWPIARSLPRIVASVKRRAGERDWQAVAYETLGRRAEIRRVVRFLARDEQAEVHLTNLRFFAAGYLQAKNPEAWQAALAEVSSPSEPPAPR